MVVADKPQTGFNKEVKEEEGIDNSTIKSFSDEEIKKIVDSAIDQNPLVYKRLAEI